MYGNPGDYAWGRGGLDVIVTQLLNQMDGTGPPPLKGETIDKIPKVKVTQEHIGKRLRCCFIDNCGNSGEEALSSIFQSAFDDWI